MALVRTIDGVPAYSTVEEALQWGLQYGITNYHTHVIAGEIAYMAGVNHDEITTALRLGVTAPSSSSSSMASSGGSSGSSGGGGGGGY